MKRLGVISDTHLTHRDDLSFLSRIALTHFRNVEIVLHAGDIGDARAIEAVFHPRPMKAVLGNMDDADEPGAAPALLRLRVEDARIIVVHGSGYALPLAESLHRAFPDADAIVFGHTHTPYRRRHGRTLLFNPGSPNYPRGGHAASVGLLNVDGEHVTGHILLLKSGEKQPGGKHHV